MGRNHTPTAILDARGGFISHKNRRRPDEPSTTRPLGSPPKSLTVAERKVWRDLVAQSCPGVLMYSDRLMFEVLCRLAARFHAREAMLGVEVAQMITLAAKFALTPVDRAKVAVEKPKASSLGAFLARNKSTPPTTI